MPAPVCVEVRRDALRVGFDRAIKLEFHCPKVSSNAGLFPYLDLDEAAQLTDPRGPPDFDGDGTVGILDLLTLLANWGPCR